MEKDEQIDTLQNIADSQSNGTPSDKRSTYSYCALREKPARVFAPGVNNSRQRLINLLGNKWVNGTILHYYFFDKETDGENVKFNDGSTQWISWVGDEQQRNIVTDAFNIWKEVGIGIDFVKVDTREEAEIRIGFMQGDGSWSYLGRDILEHSPNERTMNFGWDLQGEKDTAIHEIGHTLGFPHEHQNPKSGIIWDENAVYASLAAPPNNWDQQTTFWNIIRKIPLNEVAGTNWDPDSIMHYPFGAGLIKEPIGYKSGILPAGGLSKKDKDWVKSLYPQIAKERTIETLYPSQSVLLKLATGEQRDFLIIPEETRYYNFQTFGTSDSVMVLFEEENGEFRYRTGDDDSGEDKNAYFKIKLVKGHKYSLRLRLYYSERPGETAVMMW